MRRLSSYTILSDRLKKGGYALLSGITGALDVIGDELNGILRDKMRGADPHDIWFETGVLPENIEAQWLDRGYLTNDSHQDEKARLKLLAEVLHEYHSATTSIVIVPDMDCNYRCFYCFEKHLHADGVSKPALEPEEVEWIFKAIDQIGDGKTVQKVITLFGGEPLNAKNKAVVERIVDRGLARGDCFHAVTNGHDLDAYLPLLGKNGIATVQITMDGPQPVHDRRRVPIDGSSSYRRLIANIRKALTETDVGIGIRMNVDGTNLDDFGALVDAFDREGWMKSDRFSVVAATLYQRDKDGGIAPARELSSLVFGLRKYADRYSNIALGSAQSTGGDMVYASLMYAQPHKLKSAHCGAAAGMFIFTPGGKIYSCWEAVGTKHGEIGSYDAAGMTLDPVKSAEWFGRDAALIPECLDCRYCLICSGGCPQYAMHNNGTLYKPYCEDFPQTYPWVLADYVEKFLAEQGL